MKVILNLVTLYVCALQRFTAKFELKSKLMNPSNKKVLYNTFFRGYGMLKKLEKLNSVEGKIRKLRFTLPMTLNLGFSCIKSIFLANLCDEYS